jgi:hypothetical protein
MMMCSVLKPVLLLSLWTITMAVAGCSDTGTGRYPNAQQTQLEADSPTTPFRVVEGVLLRIEGQVYVVRDFEGRDVRFSVTKGTGMEKTPQIGEKIGAEVDRNGLAWWIWKIR